ncbi:MAG: hypothetical protein K9L32_11005 [Chromatiaceae bacterium]|nr:hypothetical protein [Chromatiaceae bacterium]
MGEQAADDGQLLQGDGGIDAQLLGECFGLLGQPVPMDIGLIRFAWLNLTAVAQLR